MAIIGVLPAAGYATRLQPIACSKEVYPIHGRPVMDWAIDRLHRARASQLRVVTRPEKTDVVLHAQRRGGVVIEGHPASLAKSIAMGLGGLAEDDIALIGFPDSLWGPEDGYVQLVDALETGVAAVLGLFQVREPWRGDVVTLDQSGCVIDIEIKPENPASSWIWGCAAARVSALRGLEACEWPGQHLARLAPGELVGIQLVGEYLDVGTRAALGEALRWRPAAR